MTGSAALHREARLCGCISIVLLSEFGPKNRSIETLNFPFFNCAYTLRQISDIPSDNNIYFNRRQRIPFFMPLLFAYLRCFTTTQMYLQMHSW